MLGQISATACRRPNLPLDPLLRQALASLNQARGVKRSDSLGTGVQKIRPAQLLDSELIDAKAPDPPVRENDLRNGPGPCRASPSTASRRAGTASPADLADQEGVVAEPSIGPAVLGSDATISISASMGVMEGWQL